jgi:hypothetical protein
MGMGGAITAVAATTTVGTEATTMAGGIITIGGDFHVKPKKRKAASVGGLFHFANVSDWLIADLTAGLLHVGCRE